MKLLIVGLGLIEVCIINELHLLVVKLQQSFLNTISVDGQVRLALCLIELFKVQSSPFGLFLLGRQTQLHFVLSNNHLRIILQVCMDKIKQIFHCFEVLLHKPYHLFLSKYY
jgi:hypothetical protein